MLQDPQVLRSFHVVARANRRRCTPSMTDETIRSGNLGDRPSTAVSIARIRIVFDFVENALDERRGYVTKAAALEAAAFGVRVTAVAPGPIATGMLDRFAGSDDAKAGLLGSLPLKRAGTPEEVARVIMFAASEAASYM